MNSLFVVFVQRLFSTFFYLRFLSYFLSCRLLVDGIKCYWDHCDIQFLQLDSDHFIKTISLFLVTNFVNVHWRLIHWILMADIKFWCYNYVEVYLRILDTIWVRHVPWTLIRRIFIMSVIAWCICRFWYWIITFRLLFILLSSS